MNILTIGLGQNMVELLDSIALNSSNRILHLFDSERALLTIKDARNVWDWIILQGHEDPERWKSVLCAAHANASNAQITVLSSHIDGTRLKTPVCSMHTGNDNSLTVSRCAMQSLLQQEHSSRPAIERKKSPAPMVFEYHAPCR